MIPLRAAMPKTVKKPTSDPSEMTPPPSQAASTPPTRADGQREEQERGQAPAAEGGHQDEEDADHGDQAEEQHAGLRCLPLRVLAEHLGVVAEREGASRPGGRRAS